MLVGFTNGTACSRIISGLCLGLSALALGACGSLGTKLDSQRAHGIHRVAILGYEVMQERPTDNLGISAFKSLKEGAIGDSEELQSMAKNIFKKTTADISQTTGWKVLSLEQMMANPNYSKKVQAEMTDARITSILPAHTERIVPKGMLDLSAIRKMSYEDQVQLAKSMGVDGFAELTVNESIDQAMFSLGHLSGDAAFTYQAMANLRVFALDSPEVVWQIQNVKGDQSRNSDDLPKETPKLGRMAKIGEEAADSSIRKLVSNYGKQ